VILPRYSTLPVYHSYFRSSPCFSRCRSTGCCPPTSCARFRQRAARCCPRARRSRERPGDRQTDRPPSSGRTARQVRRGEGTDRQTDRQRQTSVIGGYRPAGASGRGTDRQADRQTDRQTDRQMEGQFCSLAFGTKPFNIWRNRNTGGFGVHLLDVTGCETWVDSVLGMAAAGGAGQFMARGLWCQLGFRTCREARSHRGLKAVRPA
jgi:hypothetical protein